MIFAVITNVVHCQNNKGLFAYAPYVREMNLWFKHVDEVILVAPVSQRSSTPIDLAYNSLQIKIKKVAAFSFVSIFKSIRSSLFLPIILIRIFSAMRAADHIHLRCPSNMGLLGCFVQVLFPQKIKSAKYAGNWDPNAKQPLSYRLQKWILSNTFLTKNMSVLVYGEWPDQSKNIVPFFTASYSEHKIGDWEAEKFHTPFWFLFVGNLSSGKRPMYAMEIVRELSENGIDCRLDMYGDGNEREALENYILSEDLSEIIILHGNQTAETVEEAFKASDFLILASKSEGWPKVVAEAMFWKTIPIVTPVSCLPWMLDNGNRGMLLSMDIKKDIKLIRKKLKEKEQLWQMAREAEKWSHQYTLERFDTEIKKLL